MWVANYVFDKRFIWKGVAFLQKFGCWFAISSSESDWLAGLQNGNRGCLMCRWLQELEKTKSFCNTISLIGLRNI